MRRPEGLSTTPVLPLQTFHTFVHQLYIVPKSFSESERVWSLLTTRIRLKQLSFKRCNWKREA